MLEPHSLLRHGAPRQNPKLILKANGIRVQSQKPLSKLIVLEFDVPHPGTASAMKARLEKATDLVAHAELNSILSASAH